VALGPPRGPRAPKINKKSVLNINLNFLGPLRPQNMISGFLNTKN